MRSLRLASSAVVLLVATACGDALDVSAADWATTAIIAPPSSGDAVELITRR